VFKVKIMLVDGGNVPVEEFDSNSDYEEILKSIEYISKNPGRFTVVLSGEFLWEQSDTKKYIDEIAPLIRMIIRQDGNIEPTDIFAFFQVMAATK